MAGNREVGADDHTMVLLGALGPIHHPKARTAAVIGMGTGTSSAVLLAAPQFTQVDTIEIEPLMVEAERLFLPRVDKVFTDPRSRIVIDDARAHFAADIRHRTKILQGWVLASPESALLLSSGTTHAVPREAPELVVWGIERVMRAIAGAGDQARPATPERFRR